MCVLPPRPGPGEGRVRLGVAIHSTVCQDFSAQATKVTAVNISS